MTAEPEAPLPVKGDEQQRLAAEELAGQIDDTALEGQDAQLDYPAAVLAIVEAFEKDAVRIAEVERELQGYKEHAMELIRSREKAERETERILEECLETDYAKTVEVLRGKNETLGRKLAEVQEATDQDHDRFNFLLSGWAHSNAFCHMLDVGCATTIREAIDAARLQKGKD